MASPDRQPTFRGSKHATRRDPWLDQAHEEIGQTAISKPAALVLVMLFGAMVVGNLLADTFLTDAIPAGGSDAEERAPTTVETVLDLGRSIAHAARSTVRDPMRLRASNDELLAAIDRTESRLEDDAWLRGIAAPTVQSIVDRLGTTIHQHVIRGPKAGDDTWLAYGPGVDYVVGKPFLDPKVLRGRALGGQPWQPPTEPDPRPAIRRFADDLKSRGIALLIVPTPTKIMLHPEAIGADADAGLGPAIGRHNPSFGPLVRDLEAAGIDILDPTPMLDIARRRGTRLFLHGDSHWTPRAVDLVAAEIAARLAERIRTTTIDLGPSRPRQRDAESRDGVGDLVRMLTSAGGSPEASDPSREQVTVQRVTADGEADQQTEHARVLVLGDSFSGVYADDRLGWGTGAGLADQLAFHLGRDVASLTVQGGGAAAARRRFREILGTGAYPRLQVLVWQVAVRELSSGTWPVIGLESPRDAEAANRGAIRVTATVAARARPPRAGETPYPDALIAVHLIDVEPAGRTADASVPDSILVYTWGLRDNQPASGDLIVVGERVTVDLVPWSDVAGRLGGLERRELARPSLLALDAYWMEAP